MTTAIAGATAWIKSAPWDVLIGVALGVLTITFFGLLLFLRWIKSWPEPTLLKVDSVEGYVLTYEDLQDTGVIQRCQIRITNKGRLTARNIRVEITDMDTNPQRIKGVGPNFIPVDLSPEDGYENMADPGATIVYRFLTRARLAEAFGKVAVLGDIPAGSFATFLLDTDYRMILRVTATDFPITQQIFIVRFVREGAIARFTLKRD